MERGRLRRYSEECRSVEPAHKRPLGHDYSIPRSRLTRNHLHLGRDVLGWHLPGSPAVSHRRVGADTSRCRDRCSDEAARPRGVHLGPLGRSPARSLRGRGFRVRSTFVCDPRENPLISRYARKSDQADAYALCRLLRLGELKAVYQATEDHRAVFKAAVQHYIDMRKQQVALKQKIKSTFRRWGIPRVKGQRLYSADGREAYLGSANPASQRGYGGSTKSSTPP